MRVDLSAFLAAATTTRAEGVRATVVTVDETGAPTTESVHELDAQDLLHWTYRMRDERTGETLDATCNGHQITRTDGTYTAVSELPVTPTRDDPRYFYTWLAIDDTWLVEMLRPVDLLARVLVTEARPEDNHLVLRCEPLGNEPSPYNGFSIPDGRQIVAALDLEQARFSQVDVYHQDKLTARFALSTT
ncbi:hypothetical protein C3Y87_10770 [Carbonactinospora thermoautotrophica]|uniref:hypothetical protein n=1 Tax=Carbonactinospora thermoautotrophica TaxID=1469144 RepID=UPI002270FB39|nr:hypothetical protein [Carbonactinospora thermoautotrophica]MCX9191889.1 hypothetical protein [Carbonactinospora thermoautotrophica]